MVYIYFSKYWKGDTKNVTTKTEQEEKENGTTGIEGNESGSGSGSNTPSGNGIEDGGHDNSGNNTGTGERGIVSDGTSVGESTDVGTGTEHVEDVHNGTDTGRQHTVPSGDTESSTESAIERRRRLDRERKREQRERDRASRNNPSTSTSTGSTRRASTTEQKKTSPLVVKPDEQKAPRQVKNTPVQSVAEKRRGTTKAGDINSSEMSDFIQGIFSIIGLVTMSTHWKLSKAEADQIADPLTVMLNKQNAKKKKKVNEVMTPMLLLTAISAIVVPRLLLTIGEWKHKNEQRKQQRAIAEHRARNTSGQVAGETHRGSGGMDTEVARAIVPSTNGRNEYERQNDDANVTSVYPNVPPTLVRLAD